jgi:hypothetical protein
MATKRKRQKQAAVFDGVFMGLSHPNASVLARRQLKRRFVQEASLQGVLDEYSPWWAADPQFNKQMTICAINNHCCCKKIG